MKYSFILYHNSSPYISFPCREWAEDGQLWVQYVSSTPATRLDVVTLQEKLDTQLQTRKARETGICPVREELYSQCFGKNMTYFISYHVIFFDSLIPSPLSLSRSFTFPSDELIRQITINCAERGLLLLRVRDEARMTISAYETLYESSIAYGIRKALMAEQKKSELSLKIRSLGEFS